MRPPRRSLAEQISDVSTTEPRTLIQHTERGILIPHGVDLSELISELDAIHADRTSGDEKINLSFELPVPPWEGAYALVGAIQKTFGIVRQLPDKNGRREQLYIPISSNETAHIPWGWLDLPGMRGRVEMASSEVRGQIIFHVTFNVMRKYEERARQIVQLMSTLASGQCLHQGKAFSIVFRDSAGDLLKMPSPTFFPFSPEVPVFSRHIQTSIERNIIVPLIYASELAKKGVSLKRGVLFAGEYGLGKTMLANHIARQATEAGWTFIYVKNSAELPDAIRFAMRYQPVVLFGEDVDRVAGIERTDEVNELLNQLDGIDGKTVRMITILTTNQLDRINPAMMRPGRIDMTLKILPPDAEAVEMMLKTFGGDRLAPNIDLTEPALLLAGQSPARIREMLQRSTLEVLRRTGDVNEKIVADDLVAMAEELLAEYGQSVQLTDPKRVNGDGGHTESRAVM